MTPTTIIIASHRKKLASVVEERNYLINLEGKIPSNGRRENPTPPPPILTRGIIASHGTYSPFVTRCRPRLVPGGPASILIALVMVIALAGTSAWITRAAEKITVTSLFKEMVDFETLAQKPQPFFKEATASSYSRESHKGGEAWFDNKDVGQYVRTESNDGRKEHVLADLKGPGTITRFWSANPTMANLVRFYFDGEQQPRLELPFADLFKGEKPPFSPAFSYISGTGGNLYFPLPYSSSLKITIEEREKPVRLYYEIGYRSYELGTAVETFDPRDAADWESVVAETSRALLNPKPATAPDGSQWLTHRLTIRPGKTESLPEVTGEKAIYEWSGQVFETREGLKWDDPKRAHNAYRFLNLDISFDGEKSISVPLGDFFGSGPGVYPYENLFFTVDVSGKMASRLLMPFKKSMRLSLTNAGKIPYTVELKLHVGERTFTDSGYHLRAQWGTLTRESWPFFDTNFLETEGEGKVIGTVYQIANPVLIWWGEGDQKVWIDGKSFPSTFGTGTEDDYGFAYGYNRPFARPFHAQTRVDGPWSGGHISLNRWYVLDALPYRTGIRFDQEMWHWMPCRPTWSHVIYWYAKPGTPGPREIDRAGLAPRDLGIRENMIEPFEGEALAHEATGGTAGKERLANCAGAEHLVWRGAQPGDKLTVHFMVAKAGRYSIELNLCQSPDYGRQRLYINGNVVRQVVDGYSPKLYWLHAKLGVFDFKEGKNVLTAEALEPNPKARPGNLFGLDYIFLVKQ